MKTFKFWDNAPARTAIILVAGILTASAYISYYAEDGEFWKTISDNVGMYVFTIAAATILVGFFVGVYNETRKKK